MCPRRLLLYLAVQHLRQQIVAVKGAQSVAAERRHMAAAQRPQTAIVVVLVGSAAGSLAAGACQDVQHSVCLHPDSGVGYDWAHHTLVVERIDVVRVCCQVVGNVVAANGREVAHTGVGFRLGVVGSVGVVVDAQEEMREVVGRTDRLVEAHNIAVDLVALSRVSKEV